MTASHNGTNIPNQQTLVPADGGAPTLISEHAPIDTNAELCVALHLTELMGTKGWAALSRRSVGPNAAGHVVAGAQQDIAEVGGPGKFTNSILVTLQECQRGGLGLADVNGTDDGVDSSNCENGRTIFIPIMREGLRRRKVVLCATKNRSRTMNGDQLNQVV